MSPARDGWGLLIGAALVCLGAALVQAAGGAYAISLGQAWDALTDPALWGHGPTWARLLLGDGLGDWLGLGPAQPLPTGTLVVWSVRVPRIIVGALVGADLAVAGAIFQALTRNDLASPYTLGVGAGAGLGVWVALVALPSLGPHLPLVASLGGAAAFVLVYAIAWQGGAQPTRLVLAGVIVAALAGSVQTALFFMAPDLAVIQDAAAWTAGSLSGVGWAHVRLALPLTVLVLALAFGAVRALDVIHLGDGPARALGQAVERARFGLAALAILAAATSVSVAGHVAFVGLIVPHVVRARMGGTHRDLLLGCVLVGPALLCSADAVARLALSPIQLPVGVVTGLLGGAYFLWLMRRHSRWGQ